MVYYVFIFYFFVTYQSDSLAIMKTPLEETGCLSNPQSQLLKHPVFNSPSFPNTVSYAILGNFSLTLQHLGNLWDPIGHQELLTQPLPREADDFSCGSKYNKDVSLPTYLDYYVVTITITIVVV